MVRGLAGLLRGGTMTESFYASPGMQDVLREWCESTRFDAVVAFSSSMAPYALAVPTNRRVLDLCDLDSQKWMDYAAASHGPARWFYRTEGRRLALQERSWIDILDATLLITVAEAELLDGVVRPERIHIVGNGVNLPDVGQVCFHPRIAMPDERSDEFGTTASPWVSPAGKRCQMIPAEVSCSSRRPTVGFVGAMDYRPNVDAVCWFVSKCWKRIRRDSPDALFRIVGRLPVRRVRKLSSVPGVEVVGSVESAMAQVQMFDVSVAPMRIARGLQNKVLEAMACRKPVVLTSGAATGIGAKDGEEYLIADRPDEIVRLVTRLLGDPAERERIGQAARRFVAVHHSWEESLRKFELVVTGVLERATRRLRLRPTAVPAPTESRATPTAVRDQEPDPA